MVDFNHGDLLTYLSKINDNGNSIIFVEMLLHICPIMTFLNWRIQPVRC